MAGYDLGTAWIQVAISTNKLQSQIREAMGGVDTRPAENRIVGGLGGAFKQVGKIAATTLTTAATIGTGLLFGDIAKQAIDASDATNKFANTLKFAGKSSEEVKQLSASVKDYADKTVYGLGDIQNITAQLASNNVANYDKLAEAAGNLNAVAGGNAETFKSVGMVLTQTAGQGKLTTENWNQLSDAIAGASGPLQEQMLKNGAYTGNFRDAMQKGEITAEEFNQAIMQLGMTDVAKEAATSTQTIEGAWGNLEAALVSGGMSVLDRIKPALTGFMSQIATGSETAFGWINDKLIPGIGAVWDVLAHGQFDGSDKLFGLEEDSGVVDFLFKIGESARAAGGWITGTLMPGLQGVASILFSGDYQGPDKLFGLEEDSGLVDFLFRIRDGAMAAGEWINNTLLPSIQGLAQLVFTGDTNKPILGIKPDSALMGFFEGLRDAVSKAVDAALKFSGWVIDNKGVLSTLGVTIGTVVASFYALNTATRTMAAIQSAGSLLQFVAGLNSMKRAVDLAKGAQAAFNVVMNANPIFLVVTAIAAVTAGLAWFFTQTETGKKAWASITAEFKKFLDWIAPYWDATINALGSTWNTVWGAVSGFFTSYVVPVISGAVSVLSTVWSVLSTAVSTVWNGIKTAISGVVNWISSWVGPVLSGVWTGIKVGVWVLATAIALYFQAWKVAISTVVDWIMTYVAPVLSAVWDGIKIGAQALWAGIVWVWDGIKAAAAVVVGWFQTYVQPVLSLVWSGIQVGAQLLWAAMQWVWSGIKTAVFTVVSWFQTYVQPVLSLVWDGIKAGAQLLWDGINWAWNGIKSAVLTVVSWFQTYVQPVISTVWNGIKSSADTLWNGLKTIWDGIKATINTVVTWFQNTVKPIFDTVTTNIKKAFETMKSGIQTVWDGVKSVAAKPINFIINTVYRDGIKKTADSIADKLGLGLRLPSVSGIPGYASGGVLPGYTPGRDVFHFYSPDGGGALALSGGEAIMRPEWVRAVGGPSAIERMNDAASRGSGRSIPGGDRGAKFAAFADGGIWDKVKGAAKSGWDSATSWISSAADAVSSIISDPLGAVENLMRVPMNLAMKALPGSAFFHDMAGAIPGKWVDSFGEWLKGKTATMATSDIVNAARMAIGATYVWGGSSIPPGVDCSGLVYWAAHQMGSKIPRLTAAGYQAGSTPGGSYNTPGTLLFWGAPAHHIAIASGGGRMVEAPTFGVPVREVPIWGSPTTGLYKFDNGGFLQPGITPVLNATGKPEPVFTSNQWDKIDALLARQNTPSELTVVDVDGKLVGRMRVEAERVVIAASSDD